MNPLTRRDLLRNAAVLGLSALADRVAAYGQAMTPPQIDTLVKQYMDRYGVPGLSLCFMRGKSMLYNGAFGMADTSHHTPVTTQNLFRIASCSKAFTSAGVFFQIQRGKYKLTDKVFTPDGLLPQYANLGKQKEWLANITVHHLLTHTCGGWTNDGNDPMFQQPQMTHDQLIRWTLNTHPLTNAPGQHYAYSNFGYCVLGRVIERISGLLYPEFMHATILRTLGAGGMQIAEQNPVKGEVQYYGQKNENPYNIPVTRMDSHGGWIATPRDMAHLMSSLFTAADNEGAPALLQPESVKTMTTGTSANQNYGCGLLVNSQGNAWHGGSLPGSISLMVHTHSGMSWAAVMNSRRPDSQQDGDIDRLMWKLAQSVPAWKA